MKKIKILTIIAIVALSYSCNNSAKCPENLSIGESLSIKKKLNFKIKLKLSTLLQKVSTMKISIFLWGLWQILLSGAHQATMVIKF